MEHIIQRLMITSLFVALFGVLLMATVDVWRIFSRRDRWIATVLVIAPAMIALVGCLIVVWTTP